MNQIFTGRQFTGENGFTSGIEGPACDAIGNLYAVNFERQHTVGKVTPEGECSDQPLAEKSQGVSRDVCGAEEAVAEVWRGALAEARKRELTASVPAATRGRRMAIRL